MKHTLEDLTFEVRYQGSWTVTVWDDEEDEVCQIVGLVDPYEAIPMVIGYLDEERMLG